MPAALGQVKVVSRMLSTIAASERIAADRSYDATRAYALAALDLLTGLRNRRGWEAARHAEEQRSRRYGSPVSVLVLDLDDLKSINDTDGHAAGDAALITCGRVLCNAGVGASVGVATRRQQEGLEDTWHRADQAT